MHMLSYSTTELPVESNAFLVLFRTDYYPGNLAPSYIKISLSSRDLCLYQTTRTICLEIYTRYNSAILLGNFYFPTRVQF